jgi:short subunit dehydrogenase-like uncharacterized protein
MADPLLIYGATGYTARLIIDEVRRLGVTPILAGRNGPALAALGAELGLPWRVARLDDATRLDAILQDVDVVVHAAGPFGDTAAPMLAACLRNRANYLDIAGELPAFAASSARDAEARARAIMVMPGVGFDVVPSDCLAAYVANRCPGADDLAIGIRGLAQATRGSARTLASYAGTPPVVRRDGELRSVPWQEREFDFGRGPERSVCISWGDVVSAFHTTAIRNISVYFDIFPGRELSLAASHLMGSILQLPVWQTWLRTMSELVMDAPTGNETELAVVAEATDRRGRRAAARLRTPDAYRFTARTAAEIARRVLGGDFEVGWQTPARVYGPDFVLGFPGVEREDL